MFFLSLLGILNLSSDGIASLGEVMGFVFFSNDLVEPATGGFASGTAMGTQTGHCVVVEVDTLLACYFNFNIDNDDNVGRITVEALFDLVNFPSADLVITGGTGDFIGIVGGGKTAALNTADPGGDSFIYNLEYKLL